MFDLSAEHTVRGFTEYDYIFIADYLQLLKDKYSLIKNDVILNTHFSGLINRLYDMADISYNSDNYDTEFFIAVVEHPDS